MIKAIFFDIDGTLVPFGQHAIPQSTQEALREVRKKGIKTFVATGRHIVWVDNLGDTEFDGFVTVNGGQCLLSDRKESIYQRSIDNQDIENLMPFISSHGYPFIAVPANGDIFITHVNEMVKKMAAQLHIPPIPVRSIEEAKEMEIVQLMGFFTPEEQAASGVFDNILNHCEPTRWCPYFTDIIPIGSNKSVGIDRMIDHFGISLADTMAFGDGGNDTGMLEHVTTGVAMDNADDEVKAAANYVTAAVDDDGVVKALRHFGLL